MSFKSSEKRKIKRAMFGAWTDNESSSSSSEEEEQSNFANFCLMVYKDDEEQSSDNIYDFTIEELMTAFDELMSEFKKAGKKIDKLKVIN